MCHTYNAIFKIYSVLHRVEFQFEHNWSLTLYQGIIWKKFVSIHISVWNGTKLNVSTKICRSIKEYLMEKKDVKDLFLLVKKAQSHKTVNIWLLGLFSNALSLKVHTFFILLFHLKDIAHNMRMNILRLWGKDILDGSELKNIG